jgi:hypothetical protein
LSGETSSRLRRLLNGERCLGYTLWVFHVAVWLLVLVLLEFLSKTLGMSARRLVGTPIGILFVVFNIIALMAVVKASGKQNSITKKVGARAISAGLLILSLWAPVYFYGRPLIVLDADDPATHEFFGDYLIEQPGSEAER